jgi:hypothetical protein
MDDNLQVNKPVQPASPNELLFVQTQSLSELVELQKTLKEQITGLSHQNQRIIELLENVSEEEPNAGLFYVKIEDINMPFKSMIGFWVKVSLAAIPAMIVLAAIYMIVVFILGSLGFGLGSLF